MADPVELNKPVQSGAPNAPEQVDNDARRRELENKRNDGTITDQERKELNGNGNSNQGDNGGATNSTPKQRKVAVGE